MADNRGPFKTKPKNLTAMAQGQASRRREERKVRKKYKCQEHSDHSSAGRTRLASQRIFKSLIFFAALCALRAFAVNICFSWTKQLDQQALFLQQSNRDLAKDFS
jgi:hypothetical protein